MVWGGHLDDGDHQVAGLYALAEPLDVGTRDAEADVLATLCSLAEALGATVPAADARLRNWLIPIPGTRIRSGAGLALAECLELTPDRVYSLEQLERATVGGGKGRAKK